MPVRTAKGFEAEGRPRALDSAEARRFVTVEHGQEKRENILRELNEAVEEIRHIPEDKRTPRQKWAIETIDNTLPLIQEDGLYEVRVDGHTQREGLPVDELIAVLGELKESTLARSKRKFEQTADLENRHSGFIAEALHNDEKDATSEDGSKRAYYKLYEDFPPDIRARVDKLRQQWARTEAMGEDYQIGGNRHILQTGEAVRQVINQILEEGISDASAARYATRLAKFLESNSRGYFEARPDMAGDFQHWRTELEAKLISDDWRKTRSPEGDYALAMEVISRRRELILPSLPRESDMGERGSKEVPAGGETPIKKSVPGTETEPDKTSTTAEPKPAAVPEPAPEAKKKHKVVIVETAMAAEQARAEAEHRLSSESYSAFTGTIRRIWRQSLAKHHLIRSESARLQAQLVSEGNVYALRQRERTVHEAVIAKIVDQFADGYS